MSAGARCIGFATCGLLLAFAPLVSRSLLAFAMLAQLTGAPLPAALRARLYTDVDERSTQLSTSAGAVRVRRYVSKRALAAGAPGVLLLHGVHAQGIAEARLVGFARTLAQAGLDVLTPELEALTQYHLVPELIPEIQAIAAAHARQVGAPSVGVIGISFSGGLALLAAAEQQPNQQQPIGFVLTVGAHSDLVRLCHYYAGDDVRGPRGEVPDVPAHPYGARVMLRQHLERFVEPPDLALTTLALDTYLHDQHPRARALAKALSPAGQRFMAIVLGDQRDPVWSTWLAQLVEVARPQLMAASPHGQLGALTVPVFLLHGAGDPIIPSIEAAYLTRDVPAPWLRQVVVTKLLRHAEFPEPPTAAQAWQLVHFMRHVIEVAGSTTRR